MSESVIIIGAGVMGCACALELLKQGESVTLLERALPGAESSAAAAGILGAQSEVADAGPYLELCLASRALFRDYARELAALSGVDVGYEDSGVLEVALTPVEGRIAAGRAAWMLERGLRVEVLDREGAHRLEPALTATMIGANYYPDDHQVDPERLSRALAGAVRRLGGVFHTGSRVLGIQSEAGRVTGVLTDHGVMPGERVVVAAGAWSTTLPGMPPLRTTVKPMAGQMVRVDLRPPAFRHVVYGYKGYVVPRADGRVLLGSTLEERGFDKVVTLDGVRRIAAMGVELVPLLGQARWLDAWSGLRPATLDNLPLLGAGPMDGLYLAAGHFRNGILLTPITGRIIADLVTGRAPMVDVSAFAAW